jgi:hypothetical protein
VPLSLPFESSAAIPFHLIEGEFEGFGNFGARARVDLDQPYGFQGYGWHPAVASPPIQHIEDIIELATAQQMCRVAAWRVVT